MTMRPVKTLGMSLEALKDDLDIAEAGERAVGDEHSEIWAFRESGVVAKAVNGCVTAVVLYSDGYKGFAGYRGETDGLRLDSSKQIVRFKFGYPTIHRERGWEPGRGNTLNFDRYDYEDHSLQFEYDESGKWLRTLTILSPDELRQVEGEPGVRSNRPVVYDKAKYHLDSVLKLELPEEQAAVHTAFFLGWLMDNDLCSEEFIEDSHTQIKEYKQRKRTALELYARWDYCLVDDMLNDDGNAFAQSYFDFSTGKYIDDYAALLARKVRSEFHVPYTWKNQKKIGHQISKRYVQWKHPERSVSLRRNREHRGHHVNETKLSTQRPVKSSPGKKPPIKSAPASRPAARRRPGPARRPRMPSWVFKFIVLPILFVGICLAVVIYAGTL